MQVVLPGTPLNKPNICFLCENWPNPEDGNPTVDTLRELDPGVVTKLTGRKYVCFGCASDIAETIGFVSGATYHETIKELEERTLRINRLEAVSTAVQGARALQASLAALLPDVDSLAEDEYDLFEDSPDGPVRKLVDMKEAVDATPSKKRS